MRVQKIHLFNFRSVEDLTLDLTNDGLHALIGSFGSGKSSFLTGLRFALFGDNGEAGANLDLRRRGCPEGDDAGCEVTFTHENTTYVARRWLRRSVTKARGVAEKAQASLTINGTPVDGITARTLTQEMEEILGMNAKAFTSASLIPQGEVATLMKASPAEVQALIEEHTGLDVLTKQRDLARKRANDAEATAKALPGDAEDLYEKENQLKDAGEETEEAQAALKIAQDHFTATNNAAKNAHNHASDLRAQERKATDHKTLVTQLTERANSAKQAVEALTQEAAEAGVDLHNSAEEERANKLAHIDQQLDHISTAGRRLKEAVDNTATANKLAAEARNALEAAGVKTRELDAQEQLLTEREQRVNSEAHNAAESISASLSAYATEKAELERLNKALNSLYGHNGNGHQCPTCFQEVSNFQALVADLEASRDGAQRRMDKAVESGRAARTVEKESKQALVAINEARGEFERHRQSVNQLQRDVERLNTAAEQALSVENQHRNALASLVGYHDGGDDELFTQGRELHVSLKNQRDMLVAASGLQQRYIRANHDATLAQEKLVETQSLVVDAPSAQEIAEAEKTAQLLRTDADQASQALNEATSDHAQAKSAQSIMQSLVEQARFDWSNKVAAQSNALVTRGEADVLSALRSDLLNEFTRSICRSASDLLAGFGGEYVAFRMDDDFVPRAELGDGTLVRTAILSGGEAAMVGLAFRIGITLHITGGGMPEQILGDEVTNYLDEDGRRAVLAALNSIFPSVLLISHTAEVEDYASQVHRVERAELQATRWVDDLVNA